jgi:predicted transcriptional regulator
MGATKLETYIDIAHSLLDYGPLGLGEIAALVNVDIKKLKAHVSFLVAQRLIQEEKKQSVTYSITESGIRILNFFKIKP